MGASIPSYLLLIPLLSMVILSFTLTPAYAADPPDEFTFQGILKTASLTPVTAIQDITLSLYNVETGGTAIWTELHDNVSVSSGIFTITAGSITSLSTINFTETLYLQVAVADSNGLDSETLTPRIKITGSPFSLAANNIQGVATTVLTGSIDPAASTTVTGTGTLFQSELTVGDRITVSGETKTVTAIASNTSLTVDTAFSDNANDTTPDKLAAEFVIRDSSGNADFIIQDTGAVLFGGAIETLANAGFVLNGPDVFIADSLGVEGNIYTDASLLAGTTAIYGPTSVGIGTVTPGEDLEIEVSDTSDPAMTFDSDGNEFTIGIDSSDSDKFKISDNTALGTNDRITIDSAGNIRLVPSGGGELRIGPQNTAGNEGGEIQLDDKDGNVTWKIDSFEGGEEARFRIFTTTDTIGINIEEDDGHMGIGENSPENKLDVTSSNAETAIAITSVGGVNDVLIKFEFTDNTPTFVMGVDDSDADKFKISTTALGTNDRFVIDSAGDIGIAVNDPRSLLHLGATGSTTLTGTITTDGDATVVGSNGATFDTELTVGERILVNAETRTVTVITDSTNLTVDSAFTTSAADTSPEKFNDNYILASGKVGIGVAVPTFDLSIGDNDSGIEAGVDGVLQYFINNLEAFRLDTDIGNRVFQFNTVNALGNRPCEDANEVLETDNDGTLRCGTEDSDERLKNVVARHIRYGLNEVVGTELIQYTWNELSRHGIEEGIDAYQGFSAQNLLKVAPQLVFVGDDGYYGMDQNGLIATSWNAIRELNEKVDENNTSEYDLLQEQALLIEQLEKEYNSLKQDYTLLKQLVCFDHPNAVVCRN